MNLERTKLGYERKLPHYTILLGGVSANFENIKIAYPEIAFVRVKQIHSDAVVESKTNELDLQQIADAHYSKAENLGLCIATADCVPVFLFHPKTQLIAGIHAGWRGIANRIICKSVSQLISLGAIGDEIFVVMGPHIQKPSFECGFDVRDQILAGIGEAAVGPSNAYFENISDSKALVDVNQIAKEQLVREGISIENIHDLHIDTFKNHEFHSHRRDKEKAGRQLSFIFQHS